MYTKTTSSLIHYIASFETQHLNQKLRLLDLNTDQARTINFIANHPDSMQRDVARYLHRQEASVTNLLKGLVRRNLVVRTIPVENERTKLLSLTQAGTDLVEKIQASFTQINATLEDPLSDADATKLTELLYVVQKQLDKPQE